MNKWMMSASILAGLTCLVHIFAGGPEVSQPIQDSSLDPVVKAVSLVVWHGVSVVLLLIAVALGWLAFHKSRPLMYMTVAIQLGFALLFIIIGLVVLGTLAPMPQWVIFLLIPGLTLVGQRRG